MSKKFIQGRLRLCFKSYSYRDYDKLVKTSGWHELEHLCGMYSADGSLFDTPENEVFFDYKVIRPSMRECKEFVKVLKAKLKNTYKVRVDETLVMSGDSW